MFSPPYARAYAVKPGVADLLLRCGFKPIRQDGVFPWIAVDNPGGAAERRFEQCGIRCLRPASPPAVTGPPKIVRITIPLSEARIELLHRLLAPLRDRVDRPSPQIASVPARQ
jgi:hypothetical protein